MQEAEAVGLAVRRVSLGGLPRSDVRELLADLFDDGAAEPREETLALADALHEKTAGNPYFLRTLLLDLHGSGALTCSAGRWEWDDAAVAGLSVAENVAELRATRLHKLSRNAQEALAVAARLGGSFPFALLAEATGVTTEALVHPAQGVLVDADREGLVELSADSATFVHDRVQQAALALVPEAGRRALGERSR